MESRFPSLQGLLLAIWPLFLAPLMLSAAETNAPPKSESVDIAYRQLLAVDYFAFGGVGIAGTPSLGETAFSKIAGHPKALELFLKALKEGAPPAQMYALEGLRRLSPAQAETQAQAILKKNPAVQVMTGCVLRRDTAEHLIKAILAGNFARHAPLKPSR